MTLVMKKFTTRLSWKPKPNRKLVSWSLTSLFSTNMAISETKPNRKPRFFLQNLPKPTDRKYFETVTTLSCKWGITVQTALCYVPLFWHNIGVWRTDGWTDRPTDGIAVASTALAKRRTVTNDQILFKNFRGCGLGRGLAPPEIKNSNYYDVANRCWMNVNNTSHNRASSDCGSTVNTTINPKGYTQSKCVYSNDARWWWLMA